METSPDRQTANEKLQVPQSRERRRSKPDDARETRIGEIREVHRHGSYAGTGHRSTVLVIKDDVPELVDLLHADFYGRDEARVRDDRAVACGLYSLPFGQIHVLDRIENSKAVGHLAWSPWRIRAGLSALSDTTALSPH